MPRSGPSVRRPLVWLLIAALAACGILSACSGRKTLAPKLAPETTVFVQGPLDTVSYKVHLHWFGTDTDGYVTAYEIRFKNPAAPAETAWVRTTRTDSLILVYTPSDVSEPLFEVRAIDDDGIADPTPARQQFLFRNQPPVLTIVSGPGPRDSTYASATVSWTASDPDGDIRNATYRVWLDGHANDPEITTATTFTVPSEQFLVGGVYASGPRTLSVQAIDDAGYATVEQTLTWFVRAPSTGGEARLLIIDDEPGNTGPQGRQDSLYVNTAIRNLPPGTFSILRLEFTQPFRSAKDIEQTFAQFNAVIWYRGAVGTLQPILTNYRDGIAHYLEHGGKFFIEGQQLIQGEQAPGIFPESWVSQYFGSDALIKHPTAIVGDSSAAWGIAVSDASNRPVILRSTVFADSLRQTLGGYGQLRGFAVRDTDYVAAWARTGNLTPLNPIDIPVGVTVPQPGGGRLVAISFPIRSSNGFNSVPAYLARVFEQLGLTGP